MHLDRPSDTPDSGLDSLLRRASGGDEMAMRSLLDLHRDQLRRFIGSRLDKRLSSRVDPSDVVQETLADAARRIVEYQAENPLLFYPWLCQMANHYMIQAYRRNVGAACRSVVREEDLQALLDESESRLIARLTSREPDPGWQVCIEERRESLRRAIEGLDETDRLILVMRYQENQTFPEIAETLGMGRGAVAMRHLRVLRRLKEAMGDTSGANSDARRAGSR